MIDLFADADQPEQPWKDAGHRRLVATYVYTDEEGRSLHRKLRYEPKSFAQERWDQEKQKWVAGLGPHPELRRVLYRLPALLADPTAVVFVTEGEGKADLLTSWGLRATCSTDGSSRWLDDYSRLYLAGRDVAVLPDHDEPGYRFADQVVGSLVRHGAHSVRIVLLPGLPKGGDVVDFHKAGNGVVDFIKHYNATPFWTPVNQHR